MPNVNLTRYSSAVTQCLSIKYLKGIYNGNTIGVITESQISSDSPKYKQNERVILFLHKKPLSEIYLWSQATFTPS